MNDTVFFPSASDAFYSGVDAVLKEGRSSGYRAAEEGTSSVLAPDTLQAFTDASIKYNVPADVLLSIAEKDSGFDALSRSRGPGQKTRGIIKFTDDDLAREKINPYLPSEAVDAAARKLRGYMDAGMSIHDAIKARVGGVDKSKWGSDVDAYGQDILSRTQRLAETYYPGMAPRYLETEGKPTVDQLRQAFNIAPPESDAPTMGENVSDVTNNLALGVNAAVRDMNELSKRILPEKVSQFIESADKAIGGKTVEERGKEIEARLTAKLTPQMRESLQKKWWDSDKGDFGEAWKDWRSYAGPLLQSLPESVATSLPSLRLAKGVYGARIAAGATAAEAAASASTVATVAGAVSEGSLGGAQSARNVSDEIKSLPIETLRSSEAFQSLLKSGMSEAAAREALAKDQSARAFITAGLATGAFGGMGDRVIAKTFLEAAGDTGVKALAKNLGKAAVGEGFLEEMPQSALQQAAENEAMQRADQGRTLSEGVANQALGGLATGALMGVGLGGGFRTATRDTAGASTAPEQPAPTRAEPRFEGSISTMPENGTPPARANEAMKDIAAEAPGRQTAADLQFIGNAKPATAQPEAPKGPLSRVLDVGAPHVAPLATAAGQRVILADEFGEIAGHVISQDADGILFKADDGLEQLVSNQEIAGGKVAITKAPDAAVAPSSPVIVQPPVASSQPIVAQEQPAPAAVAVSETSSAAPVSSTQRPVTETVTAPLTTTAAPPVSISQQATAAVREPTGATAPAYSDMTEPELRERLKSLAQQAKAAGGWNKMFVQERKKIETAIADLGSQSAPQTTTSPSQAAAPSNPIVDPTNRTWMDELSAKVVLQRQGLADTHKVAPVEVTQGRGKNKATVTRYQIVPNVPTKLPANLAGAKPRYSYGSKQFALNFASDFDRAAYITAQVKPSKSDAAYLDFAMAASGMDEAAVRAHGARVREAIKAQAMTAEPGSISVPAIAAAAPVAASEATSQSPNAMTPAADATITATPAASPATPFVAEKEIRPRRDAQRRARKKAKAKTTEPVAAQAPRAETTTEPAPVPSEPIAPTARRAETRAERPAEAAAVSSKPPQEKTKRAFPDAAYDEALTAKKRLEAANVFLASQPDWATAAVEREAELHKLIADAKEKSVSKATGAFVEGIENALNAAVEKANARQTAPAPKAEPTAIQDAGEKIGGARKDTATSTGTKKERVEIPEDDTPAWRKRYSVHEGQVNGNTTFIITDTKTGMAIRNGFRPVMFESREAAEKAVPLYAVAQKHRVYSSRNGVGFGIYRRVTDKKAFEVKSGFKTREDAERYMAENAEEILGIKTGFGEEILAKPEKVSRTGIARRKGDVNEKDFLNAFGFRGVEFGNWNNQTERQEVVNAAYDGLMDLAEVLGVPAKAISLDGELALAFGARGHGLSGAKAHYERDYGVINLTKMTGAGSLAHEWFHALDHYLGRQDGKAARERVANQRGDMTYPAKGRGDDYVSHGFLYKSDVRPELKAAYNAVIDTMYNKAEQYVEDTEKAAKFLKSSRESLDEALKAVRKNLAEKITYRQRNNKPASQEQLAAFDTLAEQLLNGENLDTEVRYNEPKGGRRLSMAYRMSNDVLDQMSAVLKTVRGTTGFTAERTGLLDRVASSMLRYAERIAMMKSAEASDVKTKKVPTSYAMEAKKIDQGRSTDYWTTPHEMAARAFSAFVEDTIADSGNRSDFLAYGANNDLYKLFGVRPFPEGQERVAINKAFKNLVDTFKVREGKSGPDTALYSVGGKAAGMSTTDLADTLTRGKDGPIIKAMLDSGKIVIHTSEQTIPGGATQAGPVQAAVTPDGKIHLVAGNLDTATARGVLLHEAFHGGGESLVGQEIWKALMRRLETAIQGAMARREQTGFWAEAIDRAKAAETPAEHMVEEVAAYAVENAELAPAGVRDMVDRLIGAVKAWVLRRFGRQFGAVTPGQLRAIAAAALRSWEGKTNATMRGDVRYSVAAPAKAKSPAGKSLFQKATQTASDYLTDLMVGRGTNDQFNILALTPVRPLFMELTQEMPSARNYLDSKQAMDAFRNQMNHEADSTLQSWISYAKKNEEENVDLMRIMHESTLKEVDPSKPFEATNDPEKDARRKLNYRALAKEFRTLSPEAQKLYSKIRDAYKERADAVEKQIIENVKNAINLIVKNAERRHADEMERIQDEGLQGKDREEAIKAADQALTMARTRDKRSKAARLKRMREYFELNRIKGPYFPLARFGNYFVTVRDEEGKVLSFSRFESASDQRRFADDMRAAYGKKAVEVGAAARQTAGERNIDPTFIANIDSILDDADINMSVRDQVYQAYLETMPDLSMRKSRIHRKGTPGYNEDAVRAFASNMFHSAHQLARLKYGMELQDHLAEAQRELRNGKSNTVRSQAVYNEMVRAHEFTMNPDSSSFSHHITSAVFLWTMAFNLSSAVINSLQTVTSGIPNLAYDQETKGGFNKSAKELARAVRDFMVGRGSVAGASTLTDDERDAIKVGYDSGLIENTESHDLAGLADSGIDYNPRRQAFMRAASLPMHHTERFNREITYLAAYRVAREAGLSHQQAIRKASDLTWMTHFDNQANAKPRFMRKDLGKILFALKSYQANIVFRTFRDMHQSLHGADQETRTLAFKRLATTWALTAAVAGLPGAYFYGTLSSIAGAFLGMSGSDDDPDEALRKIILETMGDTMIGRAVGGMIMDGVPGYITGTALTSRLGMGDLWLRSSDRDLSAEEAWTYWMTQLGGASLGLTYQASRGLTDISKGNVELGLEKIVPSFIRNPMKAVRYAQEGVQDKSGNPIVDDVPIQDVLKQAIGFRPAEIADRYARNTYQTTLQNRIKTKAGDARKAVARAMLAGDEAAEEKAWKQVDAFNERYPEYPIRPKSIMQSMRNMERRSDRMEFGVELDPKLAEKIKEGTSPSIYRR